MAAIAGRAGGTVGVGIAIVRRPPVGAVGNVIGQPAMVLDVPLSGKGKVVAAALLEVALLPSTAVDKRDLVESEGANRVGMREVAEDDIGVHLGSRITLAMRVCRQPSYWFL